MFVSIDQAFIGKERDQQKISNIIKERYQGCKVQSPYYLCLGYLFTETYWKSLGYPACQEAVEGIDNYQKLLKHSITVYNDLLTPLFIRSFNCHQVALQCFASGHKEKAAALMAETGEIAKKIAEECKNLGKKFDLLRDKEVQILLALTDNQVKICEKQRELEQNENNATHLLKQLMEGGVSFIDDAQKSLRKITTVLADATLFWGQTELHCDILAFPYVAEIMENRELGKSELVDKEFYDDLERKFSIIFKPEPQKKTMSEVTKSMKAGRDILVQPSNSPIKGFVETIKSHLTRGIAEEFEDSYLSWLALAQVNKSMFTAAKEALVDVEEVQDKIKKEMDPLVIALQTAEKSS